jgi:hypothetical protein
MVYKVCRRSICSEALLFLRSGVGDLRPAVRMHEIRFWFLRRSGDDVDALR